MSSNTLCLDARNIDFSRQSRHVLHDVSLCLRQGELVSLLGCNGAGKTTLLRILLGLLPPDTGDVHLDGIPLSLYPKRLLAQKIAYVPQAHQPHFPYLVRDIVALGRVAGLGLFGRMTATDRNRVEDALGRMRILSLADRPYTELSCGERQLTIIARALAQDSKLLILDEPLTGLDYGHQIRLMERLRQLADDGYGILMTTHDPQRAHTTSTRIVTLIDGTIADDGTPDDVLSAETLFRLYGIRVDAVHAFSPRTEPQ